MPKITTIETPLLSSIPPVRKRTRHVRVRTGCRDCRQKRIKCIEGLPITGIGKLPCKQCAETSSECWYPDPVNSKQWKLAFGSGTTLPPDNQETISSTADYSFEGSQTSSYQAPDSVGSDLVLVSPNIASQNYNIPSSETDDMTRALQALFDSLNDPPNITGVMTPGTAFLHNLLNPTPPIPVSTFTLAGISPIPSDRAAVSYFEAYGCNEIVAAPNSRSNWIYTVLFPRLHSLLSGPKPNSGGEAAVHDFVYHSLLRLSSVHRGNMENDPIKAAEYHAQAVQHRRAALYAALKARVGYPEEAWRTEKYLSGFFTLCMADMLGSESFNIDTDVAFDLAGPATDYSRSLRDMIGVYSTIHTACTPHSPNRAAQFSSNVAIPFELSPTGGDWVERFFGVARPMIILIGQVNRLVRERTSLLRQGAENSEAGRRIRQEGEQLIASLSSRWNWQEEWIGGFRTRRIERGSLVTRAALLTLLLCEVLGVHPEDARVKSARSSAMELVADTDPQETAGYTWALSITGIYCKDRSERALLHSILRAAQLSSFGVGYRGADEILTWCWDELDREGRYKDGIAPWREALSAAGRSMYV